LAIALRSSVAAGVHHPDVAEGKIVPNGISGLVRSKTCSDFGGHFPVWRGIPSESEAAAKSKDVRIERNDEPGRGHECPRSEIDSVTANHPPQEQIEPLARAASRRAREEVTDSWPLGYLPVRRPEIRFKSAGGKGIERRADVGGCGIIAFNKEALYRTGFAKHALQDQQQRDKVAAANPAVHDRIDSGSMLPRVEVADETGRARSDRRQERLDGIQDAGDPAKGERRSAEPDHLPIVRRRVAPDDVNRVGRGVDVIEGAVQIVEPRRKLARIRPTSGTA
jgi:hypothetical protein